MFRVSYYDKYGRVSQKGGFKSDKEAYKWVREQGNSIIPLKFLVWSEEIDCYTTLYKF